MSFCLAHFWDGDKHRWMIDEWDGDKHRWRDDAHFWDGDKRRWKDERQSNWNLKGKRRLR